jgi:hypothetical protein
VSKPSPEERLLGLVLRELGAQDAKILPGGGPVPSADNVIALALDNGSTLLAIFSEAPSNREVLERKLALIGRTFVQSAQTEDPPAVAPRSLREELRALATRAIALDALVIDAQSPVVWGSARASHAVRRTEALRELRDMSSPVLSRRAAEQDWDRDDDSGSLAGKDDESLAETSSGEVTGIDSPSVDAPSADAPSVDAPSVDTPSVENGASSLAVLLELRALPELQLIRAGKSFTKIEPDRYAIHSFGIYLLVLLYDAPFDELRTRRAIAESITWIERLVFALPPHDPEPEPANVISMRKRRR